MARRKTMEPSEPIAFAKPARDPLPLPDEEWMRTFDSELQAITQPILEKHRRANAHGKEIANGKNNPPHHVPKKIG